jgi:hypothetical protein
MVLEWIGDDWPKTAVAPDPEGGCTLYSVHSDGRLLSQGRRWKEPWKRRKVFVPLRI